jgi:hypothetical protein
MNFNSPLLGAASGLWATYQELFSGPCYRVIAYQPHPSRPLTRCSLVCSLEPAAPIPYTLPDFQWSPDDFNEFRPLPNVVIYVKAFFKKVLNDEQRLFQCGHSHLSYAMIVAYDSHDPRHAVVKRFTFDPDYPFTSVYQPGLLGVCAAVVLVRSLHLPRLTRIYIDQESVISATVPARKAYLKDSTARSAVLFVTRARASRNISLLYYDSDYIRMKDTWTLGHFAAHLASHLAGRSAAPPQDRTFTVADAPFASISRAIVCNPAPDHEASVYDWHSTQEHRGDEVMIPSVNRRSKEYQIIWYTLLRLRTTRGISPGRWDDVSLTIPARIIRSSKTPNLDRRIIFDKLFHGGHPGSRDTECPLCADPDNLEHILCQCPALNHERDKATNFVFSILRKLDDGAQGWAATFLNVAEERPLEAWTSAHSDEFRAVTAAPLARLSKKRQKKVITAFHKVCQALFDGARAMWIKRSSLLRRTPTSQQMDSPNAPPPEIDPLDEPYQRLPNPPAPTASRPVPRTMVFRNPALVPSRLMTEFFTRNPSSEAPIESPPQAPRQPQPSTRPPRSKRSKILLPVPSVAPYFTVARKSRKGPPVSVSQPMVDPPVCIVNNVDSEALDGTSPTAVRKGVG